MSEKHSVSRRASLKTLGAAGALLAVGRTAAAHQGEAKPGAAGQDNAAANPIDVALGRFSKGHS